MNVRAMGTIRDPQVIGKASLQNGRLEYGDLPVHLSAMQGNMIFSRNLVRFENISGSAGSGTLRVDGLIEHQNGELRGVNLQVSAQRVRLPYPKDFRSLVDAELALRGSQESQVLSGEINVLRADYMKDINLLEQMANRSSTSPGPLTTDPFLLGLRLAVDIRSDRGIYIDTELARLRAGMLLTLKGTPAYPYLTGRVEASEGFIFFRGNRFDILHASADFLDRNRINPVLDVRAEADVKTYRLVMDVNGDLDHLSINVTSDPPLSTVDIVSLLTTGKSLEPGTESTRRQSEIAGLSAASILSESLTGVIGKRVQRIFGLQTFRVDPFLAGAENDPTARVTISERISKDLTVTFSRNLSTNEEQIVVVEYDVTRNLTVVASRDEQGKFGLDFRFRKRFR
jgi:translocation and assembly module TamB